MKNETMVTTMPETEKIENQPVKAETMTFVDTRKMAEEAIANNAELTVATEADKKDSSQQYEKLAGEIKELRSPAEKAELIGAQIQELKKELEEKERDYKNLTTTSSYSNGVGGLTFKGGTAPESLKKYPGVDKVVDLLAVAADKNTEKKTEEKADGILGKLGIHKKVKEINDYDFQLIKNTLLTGEVGKANLDGQGLLKAYETVIVFLRDNSPELLKTDKYQEMLKGVCKHDAEFKEENEKLLIDQNSVNAQEQGRLANTPTSVKEAMGFDKTVDKIHELESQQFQHETNLKIAA